MSCQVAEYLREDGTSPYEEWFMGLDTVAAAKITIVKLKLEQGNLSNVKWFRGIGEYRLDWGPGYRVYIGRDGDKLIICLEVGPRRGSKRILNGQLHCGRNTLSESHNEKIHLEETQQ
jgi:putative addiction module killer protein